MSVYKILFLDIDGTILTPDDLIEESTKEAVKQIKQKGLEVFLATGRPLHEIQEIGEELKIESFIGYNGAYAIHKGRDVFNEPVEATVVDRFLNTMKSRGHEGVLYTNGQNLLTNSEAPIVKRFVEHFHLRHNEEYKDTFKQDILGISIMNISKEEVHLYEEEGVIHLSPINVSEFKEHSYDVIRDKVNKGFAVQKVLDLLNIDKESAIAFGDGMNDKEMLKLVGNGFAMGNAQEELFQYADHQTTDVTNSGVFNGLKALGLVK
ncbi:HAD family hydrolase [Halalkalibacter akibai]|uniref:Hydrolase n=1 Tax=Halalkalibacter akibai (strain ATCC 43226 / DSM 21942 / CIP 109018 / JCM 9157 / 1139) TaxID=1236973 RepID=W4QTA5_HALA3|nr:HAD family hydrolase [Halalkalibacter akibai]GAE34863.1 hydrolase [Halalkalibacter akibai JCM 9157]